jgi:ribosomal protein S18 acetylase RimI-like enzyme
MIAASTDPQPRPCRPEERTKLLELLDRCFFPNEPQTERYFPLLVAEENLENLFVVEREGKLVAHAGAKVYTMRTPRGEFRLGDVGLVCCDPDYRRQGLGEACMQAVMERMQELECDLGWLATPIPDWYRAMGWETAGRIYQFEFDPGNLGLLPGLRGLTVRPGPWPEVAAMVELHRGHDLGAERSAEAFQLLLGRPRLQAFCAEREGRLVAYVLAQGPTFVEYAGAPAEIAALMRAVFPLSDPGARHASAPSGQSKGGTLAPGCGDGLTELLLDRRFPHRYHSGEMFWPIDLPSLLQKLGLEQEIVIEEQDDSVLFTHDHEHVTLSRRQAMKLLFGPERPAAFAPDLLPLDFYHWQLDWC